MEYSVFPNNFLELPDALSNFENSKVAILPVPYEKTTTFVKGTKNGPGAIIESSAGVQSYDEELEKNIREIGICTLKPMKISNDPESMINSIYEKVKQIIGKNRFPVVLGGEHSITQGCVMALAEKHENLSVLQIDAHTDLVDEWDNTKYSHACVGRRCFEITKNIVQVGIRSVEQEETEFARENGIKIFWAKDIAENESWFDDAISKLTENVHVTLDLDALDPSFMPSVGNPEPGGLAYYQTLKFLRKVCKEKNVVGFDVVELCPRNDNISPDFIAAKIICKLIGYKFYDNKKV